MITVITRFAVPTAITASQMRAGFTEVAPVFRNVPGLIRKQFLLSADGRTAGGVYLWEEEEAARSFMQQRIAPMIREKFQVEPTIEFYHSPVIVENGEPQKVGREPVILVRSAHSGLAVQELPQRSWATAG